MVIVSKINEVINIVKGMWRFDVVKGIYALFCTDLYLN